MKIVIFGANSPTAQMLIKQLLDEPKTEIIGMVRQINPKLNHGPGIQYIAYQLDKIEEHSAALKNAQVWVSFIGASSLFKARKVTTLYSNAANKIIHAADKINPKRIIWISSSGVVDQPNDGFFFKRILKPLFLENMYKDMLDMEKQILDSNINFTIVRPPYLTNGKKIQKVRAQEFYFNDDQALNRLSLALFLKEELKNEKWLKKIIAVSA